MIVYNIGSDSGFSQYLPVMLYPEVKQWCFRDFIHHTNTDNSTFRFYHLIILSAITTIYWLLLYSLYTLMIHSKCQTFVKCKYLAFGSSRTWPNIQDFFPQDFKLSCWFVALMALVTVSINQTVLTNTYIIWGKVFWLKQLHWGNSIYSVAEKAVVNHCNPLASPSDLHFKDFPVKRNCYKSQTASVFIYYFSTFIQKHAFSSHVLF